MRSHAPDTAGPALRADDATFDTRPSACPRRTARRGGRPVPPLHRGTDRPPLVRPAPTPASDTGVRHAW
ncbi:hypothetical protein EF908_36625 [Streptomyces sp. WAC04770]|nr:hypothetical protein EF908_36625 [Streptomyces sp. WAC04770]